MQGVENAKVLAAIGTSDLQKEANRQYINKKASTRIHFLRALKRAGSESFT